MLEYLHLVNVGPAPEMEMELAPRLNLITGDNGLGKSFLLDLMWWALTRRWPHDLNPRLTSGYPARPTDPRSRATIGFRLTSKSRQGVAYESHYVARDEAWTGKAGRPWNPGLIVYAHSDGGFSVWDPARNYWKQKGRVDVQERLPGYVFSANDVWDGLAMPVDGKPTLVCSGLLRDWAIWIRENGENAQHMASVLAGLVPAPEYIAPGPLMRLSVNDARDIPSIRTAYSKGVPIVHASAGIRRAAGLAYMLMWSWTEHVLAARQLGEDCTTQVVMLFDELESHLHPRWQRSILRSVFNAARVLLPQATIQIVAATHSPLVLASAEPEFDETMDKIFHFDLMNGLVGLREVPWAKQGDVVNWLVSDIFGLQQGRSIEAERAIEAAEAYMRNDHGALPIGLQTRDDIHRELVRVLAGHDLFWPRWVVSGERQEEKS
ncbi:AAA family ATPase [Lamprocystis purpurea]|uniref:AAA family ATPase n=1 Tax=Lamprocystis purpurea TaxID=61598 RepID=UPI00037B3413|nr:ATP-binding protein [Lamprocystis purpurea]